MRTEQRRVVVCTKGHCSREGLYFKSKTLFYMNRTQNKCKLFLPSPLPQKQEADEEF